MAPDLAAPLLWQRLDVPGIEHFRLGTDAAGLRLVGTVLVTHDSAPLRLEYEIACSAAWETRAVALTLAFGAMTRRLELAADERHRWSAAGTELAALAGCVDVDVSLTPSTNTLPIRRLGLLGLAVGEARDVTAAWVRVPELAVEPLPQRYTRLGECRFRYESRGGARSRPTSRSTSSASSSPTRPSGSGSEGPQSLPSQRDSL